MLPPSTPSETGSPHFDTTSTSANFSSLFRSLESKTHIGGSFIFSRRWFIISGNVAVFVGYIAIGSAKSTQAIIAGATCIGMELLPNRLRHIGVLIADLSTWVAVLFGPITGRYAIRHGEAWRWLFYGPAIACCISFVLLVWLYKPPQHPRGTPFKQAFRELDYCGAVLFTTGALLVFTAVIYTQIITLSDPKVIGLLVAGFVIIVVFALYETFVPLKQPMTPPEIFAKDYGREFTFPFIAGIIVNMFFYSVNIAYPTAINVLWTNATTPLSYSLELTLPQNLGLIFGSFIGSFFVMPLFGRLLALMKPDNKATIMVFVFICEGAYGWAQTLSITFIQTGVPQTQLGISGALAGALSQSIYLTILSHVQASHAASLVPKAAIAAAVVQSYVVGLRTICLASIAFGAVGIVCCCLSNDIGPKMNDKIELFLENDVQADKNRFH
ncbi:uncharacterized protein BDZ99DRAFT_506950 [Mytilinidion resinicola]|uniref:MFS general substrate transporter n=1 Tax=Mytilinidion resinicola TaxID=574789 RepID=A0A6A6Z0E1_9PEZI|nr:uncharacterized protein BDZ99DRAFT_506950 [Mytilinidion resinicola]KAF2814258.1 hypothetical protein BDZ99DRAFT_506950 [Mytilinidion resinicola]